MWTWIKKYAVRPAVFALKVGCGYHVFAENVGGARMVHGPSMLPTFSTSTEWIIEDALSVRLGRPLKRGELVVLDSPRSPRDQICKRVIGLPGDVVCVDPTGAVVPSTEHCVIPEGHIWIAGDNAAASIDSRVYGPVPIALVKTRVVARVYPWESFTIFRNGSSVLGEI
ncbi:LexA/Signal peptidase [Phellopilus nigrolimitatus]|nr:LexA/Signal peptidase [Phellopilus nigrolimitatus]